MEIDFLVVGAGFSGVTFAERAASQLGARSLIVERRGHIGGNAFDKYDEHGVLIHQYGPHYFRTNSNRIRDYLSQFTAWREVDYRILSYSDERYWNFPINLNTFEQFLGRTSTSEEMEIWLEKNRVPIAHPSNSEEVIISQVGWALYEKFFKNYTLKQWRVLPSQLDASVCGRIPVRTNRDDRYLSEKFQALPADGYTRMFERMLESAGNKASLLLNTRFQDILKEVKFKHLVYTGPIDSYYEYRFGRLPYRSLRFEYENIGPDILKEREPVSGNPSFWQPAMQVNYPNEEEFTRIVEIKHATGQVCASSTIVREYPEDFGPEKEPFYPIPTPANAALYQQYRELGEAESNVSFIGRLASYRYYNMDQVVGMALSEVERVRRFMK